ncbi:hypothetical protein BH10PSE2_BH10PSE2_09850 [soil metagenome]
MPQPSDSLESASPTPIAVVVGVLTFKRPEGLAKLLQSLRVQVCDPERPYTLTVVVVDNDPGASGRQALTDFENDPAFPLIYVIETEPGIPFGRNRAMDESPASTDVFCFVDDDEWVVPDWLDALLAIRARTGAGCVYGPVEPVYPEDADDYFIKTGVFERRTYADGVEIDHAASNNVMFDLPAFRALGLRFEERMRHTGGTDYLFFERAVRAGVHIHWADRALVYDVVPSHRMTWKWILMRQYRLGNTLASFDVYHAGLGARARRVLYGGARIALGIVMLPVLAISARRGMTALSHIFRGSGMVTAILGHHYQEYDQKPVASAHVRAEASAT